MMQIVVFLPPPPGTQEPSSDGRLDTLLVLAIVALILGAVVLVAWLLKPLVAKRLRGHETLAQTSSGAASTRWNESWSRNSDTNDVSDEAGESSEGPSLQLDDVPATTSTEPVELTLPVEIVTESVPAAIGRQAEVAEAPHDEESETTDIAEITSTVRTLLDRANSGRVREGFALYSEAALQRFRDEMGLSPEEFDAVFDAIPAPPPEQQAELAAITDVERLPDGRIRALVNYGNGGTYPPPEYFTFVPANGDGWLIDEIAAA